MRSLAVVAASLSLLLALPTFASDAPEPQEQVIEKVKLAHLPPEDLLKILFDAPSPPAAGFGGELPSKAALTGGLPPGVTGILGYPLDSSLIIRGTPAALQGMRNALRMVDAPVRKSGELLEAELRPGRVKAEALRESILKLPGGGSAVVEGGAVRLKGKTEWVHRALRLAFRAEWTGWAGAGPENGL
jgi:hypothetical protein